MTSNEKSYVCNVFATSHLMNPVNTGICRSPNVNQEIILLLILNFTHSYGVDVINRDNKMITLACIGRIIRIYQIIKRIENATDNNS